MTLARAGVTSAFSRRSREGGNQGAARTRSRVLCSCQGRLWTPAFAGVTVSPGKRGKLLEECRLVLETAQIEKDTARLDAPDDRDRQRPQGAGQYLDRGAGALRERSEGQRGARDPT